MSLELSVSTGTLDVSYFVNLLPDHSDVACRLPGTAADAITVHGKH